MRWLEDRAESLTGPPHGRGQNQRVRMAADAGNPQAQYALATLYKQGQGVKQDLQEAPT